MKKITELVKEGKLKEISDFRDEIDFLAQWEDLSVKEIILYIANYIIRNEIHPAIQIVLATPLDENNDIINDII